MSQSTPWQPGSTPPPGPAVPGVGYEPFLVTIGDIGVTATSVITPRGNAPLAGAEWFVQDRTYLKDEIPTWAIITAIVGAAFCLLGLFFLLVKEPRLRGWIDVTVRSGPLMHTTHLPVQGAETAADINNRVAYARSIAPPR